MAHIVLDYLQNGSTLRRLKKKRKNFCDTSSEFLQKTH